MSQESQTSTTKPKSAAEPKSVNDQTKGPANDLDGDNKNPPGKGATINQRICMPRTSVTKIISQDTQKREEMNKQRRD